MNVHASKCILLTISVTQNCLHIFFNLIQRGTNEKKKKNVSADKVCESFVYLLSGSTFILNAAGTDERKHVVMIAACTVYIYMLCLIILPVQKKP